MVEILGQAVAVAALGYFWWRQLRHRGQRLLAAHRFQDDVEVALHLAEHVARSRGQALGSAHILYALVQDETVAAAIRTAGGSPEQLEEAALAAFAEPDPRPVPWRYGMAFLEKHGAAIGLGTMWREATRHVPRLLAAVKLDPMAVLFVLAHGQAEPPAALPPRGQVAVVLVNDDYSTMEIVVAILREVFELPEDRAHALMLKVHHEGSAEVAQLHVSDAAPRVAEARRRAREGGHPLWIRAEAR